MKTSKSLSPFLLTVCFISAMGGLLFGYDWVVIGGAKIFYEPFFGIEGDAGLRGWAMSSATVGCLVGALMSGSWSDRFGRRRLLILSAVLFVVSAVGTGATSSFTRFILYRILGGLGIGIASNLSPIYIAELSPSSLRGRLVSLNQLTIVLGILLAQAANYFIGTLYVDGSGVSDASAEDWAWRWMFWAELVPALLFMVLSFILPESPRWLWTKGKQEEARKVFARVGGDAYAQKVCEDMRNVVLEKTTETAAPSLWRSRRIRSILVVGIVLAVFQQWCGINVIFNYAHEIFSSAGYGVSDVLMNMVVTGVTNVVFTFVAIYAVDRWGRRALMLFGASSLAVIYLILGSCYQLHLSGICMLLLVVLAIACYAMSLAPITWVVLSEIFPVRVRGRAMALSTFFLWAACFILTYTFPILNESVGAAGTFWVYGLVCALSWTFIYRRLPETKGKSLEQIEKEITK